VKNADKMNLIYIVGTSFSGSSLLGFILGSTGGVFDAGELKFFNRVQVKGGEKCTCGSFVTSCPFWSIVHSRGFEVYEVPSFHRKYIIAIKIILGIKVKKDSIICREELELLNEIHRIQGAAYILDTSKSLWRLQYLLRCRDINLKILFLKRGMCGSVSSFVKHRFGFWRGLFIYKLNNFLIRKFLKNNKLDYLYVEYDSLCKNTDAELKRIGEYLGIDYSNYIEMMKNREYHVPSGNQGTRKQFLENFQGLKHDDSWKTRLTSWQKRVLSIVSKITGL